jgi:hypothetical protein
MQERVMQDAKGSGCRAPLPWPAALQYGGRILHSGSHQGAGVEAGNVGLGGSVRDLGGAQVDPEHRRAFVANSDVMQNSKPNLTVRICVSNR